MAPVSRVTHDIRKLKLFCYCYENKQGVWVGKHRRIITSIRPQLGKVFQRCSWTGGKQLGAIQVCYWSTRTNTWLSLDDSFVQLPFEKQAGFLSRQKHMTCGFVVWIVVSWQNSKWVKIKNSFFSMTIPNFQSTFYIFFHWSLLKGSYTIKCLFLFIYSVHFQSLQIYLIFLWFMNCIARGLDKIFVSCF